jgi:diguanylate cyclase (GGDEF)-like protein
VDDSGTQEPAGSRLAARGPTLVVLLICVALLGVSVALGGVYRLTTPLAGSLDLPWWAWAVLFASAESVVLHIQVKREAQTLSLSELPTVLALFFAPPLVLLTGRLVGSLLVLVVRRRSSALKTGFNCSLVVAETTVAVAVFRLVVDAAEPAGPRAWLAVGLAVLGLTALAVTALGLVIAAYEGGLSLQGLVTDLAHQALAAGMTSTLALVAVTSLLLDSRNAWLLAALSGILLIAYRAYAALSDRHLSLERVYRFSEIVSSSPEMDEVLRSVLEEARELLRAEQTSVYFLPAVDDARGIEVRLRTGGRLSRSETDLFDDAEWLRGQVVEGGSAVLLARGTREDRERSWLQAAERREAIVVPLRGQAGVVGCITVADRMGEVRAFDAEDVLLLETVANHASIALQNRRLIAQLRHEAMHDALTSLPNRAQLQRDLQDALTEVEAGASSGLAVMILDLDGFKDVNDTLGHGQGDRLLQEVALRLVDAVGRHGTVARLGGDEFAVLLPDTADENSALGVGRRLVHALEQPVVLDELEVEVSASFGVALAPQHGREAAALLKRADMAMYAAKGSTRGLRVYEPEHDTRDVRRLTLVGELRQALQDGALQMHVQPQARLDDGQVISAEALVRWDHPERGMVPPDEFVAIAERTGLIAPLTAFVLDAALHACADWRAAGHALNVAVNLSPRSLLDADLVGDVRRALRRYDLPGSVLTLEITEGGVMADPTRAVAMLLQLRDFGVRLSVDDFGTGYSSLSYLKRLPVQEVKIDKSFVTDLRRDSEDAPIARSIVDLGRHLGLDVVAEGVEDAETWEALREMGCTIAQGYHLARAMPAGDLPAWLDRRRALVAVPLQRVV